MSDNGRDGATTVLHGLRSRRIDSRLGASIYFVVTTTVRDPEQLATIREVLCDLMREPI